MNNPEMERLAEYFNSIDWDAVNKATVERIIAACNDPSPSGDCDHTRSIAAMVRETDRILGRR